MITHSPLPDEHPTVFIMIVGETARAKNFSLNGYKRMTNPKLAQKDIVNFHDVKSSGTATAFSLPCMFSHLPQKKFEVAASYYSENLLDILQQVGYQVAWWDNDSGCKGVCERVSTIMWHKRENPKYCSGGVCYDEVLLENLEEYLSKVTQDTFLVLHTIGSHGPTYYKRYPDEFKVFTPTCDSAELQNCSQESIINTYDNTILYTDHVIATTIDILAKFSQFESGLLYVSDHGESLGESNIYLHGMPYGIAPDEQIEVPMILWMSENMKRDDHIDYNCLKESGKKGAFSHDNIFHSLVGLMEIDSLLYDEQLDIFRKCQSLKEVQ